MLQSKTRSGTSVKEIQNLTSIQKEAVVTQKHHMTIMHFNILKKKKQPASANQKPCSKLSQQVPK